MALSTIGNLLFSVSLLFQGLFFSGCLMAEDSDTLQCPEGLC